MSDHEPWTHEFAEVNGIRMHYVTMGEGPLVILLHGFPENWYSWRNQIPALAGRFKVVAPDLRGYNETGRPEGASNYHLRFLCGDVAALMDHFGEDKAVIVGHDWGGVIAYQFVADFSDRVEKLVILNAPHPKAYLREFSKNPRQFFRSWYVLAFQLPWLPERAIARKGFSGMWKMLRGSAVRKEVFSAEVMKHFIDPMRPAGALTAAIDYYRANLRSLESFRAVKQFPRIDAPTLVVWGEQDVALDIGLLEGLEGFFGGTMVIRRVTDSGHWVQQEAPEAVNQYMLEFL